MTSDEIIQATLDNPDYHLLKKLVIELPGNDATPSRKMVLVESCNEFRFSQGQLINQISSDESLSEDRKQFLLNTYAQVAPFSFGDVPTISEFRFSLSDEATAAWMEGMREINPENVKIFFPDPPQTQDAKKAKAKKK